MHNKRQIITSGVIPFFPWQIYDKDRWKHLKNLKGRVIT